MKCKTENKNSRILKYGKWLLVKTENSLMLNENELIRISLAFAYSATNRVPRPVDRGTATRYGG